MTHKAQKFDCPSSRRPFAVAVRLLEFEVKNWSFESRFSERSSSLPAINYKFMKRFSWFFSAKCRLGGVRGYSATKKELQIDGIKHAIAIASGKGGVGKSTTAVNLAVALANKWQLKVGLLDADVYGPNVPTMMQIQQKPELTEDRKMIPVENYGVKCMSMGLLVENNAALVWRGPMVSSALEKMTRGVAWGNLDILLVDMPPGTGDVQITISQRLSLSGALIVSTPQDVALMDARRGIKMFSNVHVPILGIVENMSYFTCPHCGERSYIFGNGGSRKAADEMGIIFVGEVPLEEKNRKCCDEGVPIVISEPNSVVSTAYVDIAQKVMQRIEEVESQKLLHPKIQL